MVERLRLIGLCDDGAEVVKRIAAEAVKRSLLRELREDSVAMSLPEAIPPPDLLLLLGSRSDEGGDVGAGVGRAFALQAVEQGRETRAAAQGLIPR